MLTFIKTYKKNIFMLNLFIFDAFSVSQFGCNFSFLHFGPKLKSSVKGLPLMSFCEFKNYLYFIFQLSFFFLSVRLSVCNYVCLIVNLFFCPPLLSITSLLWTVCPCLFCPDPYPIDQIYS